jgi:dTDP-4-dehydrorhamnose 3,5-epimerase-like enzyme
MQTPQHAANRTRKIILHEGTNDPIKTQGKLTSILRGRARHLAVDVRRGGPTFGQHVAVELDDKNRRQLWVPRGFVHGFVVLSETADFFYKCDDLHRPADEIVAVRRPGNRSTVAVGARRRGAAPRRRQGERSRCCTSGPTTYTTRPERSRGRR